MPIEDTQVLKIRYQVQMYHGRGLWNANIDSKLCDWYGGNRFKTIEEAKRQAQLAKRRYKAAYRNEPKLRIISITTAVEVEL